MDLQDQPPSPGDRIYVYVGTHTDNPQQVLAEVNGYEEGGLENLSLNVLELIGDGKSNADPNTDEYMTMPERGTYCHEENGPL